MKFLCPSCKAKYQIGDEKVAGRSVRMKCRKCGYVIQVSSVPGMGDALPGSEPPPAMDALSDPSAAGSALEAMPENVPPSATGTPRPAPPAKSAPAAASSPTAASPPSSARSPLAASSPSSTRSPSSVQRPEVKKIPVAGTRPTVPKPAIAPAAPKPPAPSAAKAPPPKSSAQKPAPTAPTGASSALGVKPEKRTIPGNAPLPAVAPKPTIVEKPAPASTFPEVEEEERTRIADVGALAGAFSLAVGGASDSNGPIRLSELRSKAASGSVNRESLVWRDGFEDWRPLGTFPELSAIVDESVSSARASLTPFTPSVATVLGPTPSPAAAG